MSFDGYYQLLCLGGHLSTEDCNYHFGCEGFEGWTCIDCGSQLAWWNFVDTTDGEGEEVALEILKAGEIKPRSTHKHRQIAEETRYKIPENKGHRERVRRK